MCHSFIQIQKLYFPSLLPCLALSCLALPCLTLPCLALPCLALLCLILPYLALPCPVITRPVLSLFVLSCLTCLALSGRSVKPGLVSSGSNLVRIYLLFCSVLFCCLFCSFFFWKTGRNTTHTFWILVTLHPHSQQIRSSSFAPSTLSGEQTIWGWSMMFCLACPASYPFSKFRTASERKHSFWNWKHFWN